jgi:hypothetical protein
MICRPLERQVVRSLLERYLKVQHQLFISLLSAFSEFYQDIHGYPKYSPACRNHRNREKAPS